MCASTARARRPIRFRNCCPRALPGDAMHEHRRRARPLTAKSRNLSSLGSRHKAILADCDQLSALLGAAASFAFALFAHGFVAALVLRLICRLSRLVAAPS